jgi:hypothetical protein
MMMSNSNSRPDNSFYDQEANKLRDRLPLRPALVVIGSTPFGIRTVQPPVLLPGVYWPE